MAKATHHVPTDLTAITPYLIVEDAAGLIAFLERAFGAETLARFEEDGRIAHAKVRLGDACVELADARPEWPARPGSLHYYVPDTDVAYARALEHGARSLYEPADMAYGERSGGVEDPFGNHWYIASWQDDLTDEEIRERSAAGS
ncbi:MAG TPA: VOC family protein [Thermoanaerobaculia bacterium]|nr:VOC family protein [Thermoanaerobaculia bacterium]